MPKCILCEQKISSEIFFHDDCFTAYVVKQRLLGNTHSKEVLYMELMGPFLNTYGLKVKMKGL